MLPAVVLLDATLHALERAGKGSAAFWEVNSAKFQSAVRPGEALTLQHETQPNGSVRFAIRSAGRAVASGLLVPSQTSMGSNRGEQS